DRPQPVVCRPRLTVTSASIVLATAGHGGDAWPTHAPAAHVSPVVQKSPSSHGSPLGSCVQPCAGSHASSVHGLPSSQPRRPPPTHLPAAQASPVVHASPSAHGAVLETCPQPACGGEPSSVRAVPALESPGRASTGPYL